MPRKLEDLLSLEGEINEARCLYKLMREKESYVAADKLLNTIASLVGKYEASLIRADEMLSKSSLRAFSQALGMVLHDELKRSGIAGELRSSIIEGFNARMLATIDTATNTRIERVGFKEDE